MSELRIDGIGSLPKVFKPRTVFLGVAYSLGYGLLFLLAGYIVGLAEFSLWFPAAGLRFAVLLIAGWRFGFVAAVCEILVQGVVGEWANWDGYAFTMIGGIAGPPLIYALVIWFLENRPKIRIEHAKISDILWISAAALLAPALTAPVSTGFLYLANRLPPEVFWDATASFWVGDAVGILMLAPVLSIAWNGDVMRTYLRRYSGFVERKNFRNGGKSRS